jgi:biotin carboxyl carrier protein
MADRLNEDEPRRRQSGLLDAIFDVVEQAPEETAGAEESLFRAKALEQIDVPAQVDQLLPLTSRMTWVALVGAALVIMAGLLYAASNERVSAVEASGRVVNPPGLAVVSSPVDGTVVAVEVEPGAPVSAGQIVARGTSDAGGAVVLRSPTAGRLWQVLVPVGGAVAVGDEVATVLPGSGRRTVLAAIPESQQALVKPDQAVELTRAGGQVVEGRVAEVMHEALPASTLGDLVGVPSTSGALQVMVEVDADGALAPGEPVGVKIILSKRSLLRQLFEFR